MVCTLQNVKTTVCFFIWLNIVPGPSRAVLRSEAGVEGSPAEVLHGVGCTERIDTSKTPLQSQS